MRGRFENELEFEWNKANIDKNWLKHKVSNLESEEAFLDKSLLFGQDVKHSTSEPRFLIYGRTQKGRYLAIAFTYRDKRIRIISSRTMNRKERGKYDKEKV